MFKVGDIAYLDFGDNHHHTGKEVEILEVIKGSEVKFSVKMVEPEQDWYGNWHNWRFNNLHACQIKKNKINIK